MAAFSSKPGWGEAKPLLERGVTIKLVDGSQIKLTRETASKFETIRTVIGYGGIEVGEKEDIIKIFDYPAQYVRQYFKLVDKIDGRKELPNVHFTQLFDFSLITLLMGNEVSMTNLADYIFATALANQSAGKKVKTRMREIYLSYPAGPKRFIVNRLAEVNRAISLKNLRNLDLRFISRVRSIQAIDNQGRIVTRGVSEMTKKGLYYDETDPQREKLINQLKNQRRIEGIQIGGGTKQGITVVTQHYDIDTGEYVLTSYPPGQLEGKYLISFDSIFSWEIFPFGSRFRMVKDTHTGEEGEIMIHDLRIHDLINGSLIFNYRRKSRERYVLDDNGQYLFIIGEFPDHITATLYAVGETTLDGDNRPVRRNRKLFETIIPILEPTSMIIDSYRRLIYIHEDYSYQIRRPPRPGELVVVYEGEAVYHFYIRVLLIVDFSGQVLHRYIHQGIDIFPSAKHLLTSERGMQLVTDDDLQYIIGPEVGDNVKEKMKKLPDFELWPNLSVEGLIVEDVVGRDNLWIRDAAREFKIAALVKHTIGEIGLITSSPSGDIIIISSIYLRHGVGQPVAPDSSVMQTVLYTDHEMEIINEVLSGPRKRSGEVGARLSGS